MVGDARSRPRCSPRNYAEVFTGDETLERGRGARGRPLHLARLDLRAPALASSRGCRPSRAGVEPIEGARVLAAARRLDHHRPHLARRARSRRTARPGSWLIEQGVEPRDFNSYGSRRGNHEVMIRGTFANIRLRNQLVEQRGRLHPPLPRRRGDDDLRGGDGLRRGGRAAGRARRQGVRLGLLARLGGEGDEAARRPRRDRRELRAHPPLQPDRDGRAAAAVPRRRVASSRSASPARRPSTSATSRTARRRRSTVTATRDGGDDVDVRGHGPPRHAERGHATSRTAASCRRVLRNLRD